VPATFHIELLPSTVLVAFGPSMLPLLLNTCPPLVTLNRPLGPVVNTPLLQLAPTPVMLALPIVLVATPVVFKLAAGLDAHSPSTVNAPVPNVPTCTVALLTIEIALVPTAMETEVTACRPACRRCARCSSPRRGRQ